MESKDHAVGRGGVSGWGYREKKWNDGMEKGVGVNGWGYREKKWNDGMEKAVGVRGWVMLGRNLLVKMNKQQNKHHRYINISTYIITIIVLIMWSQ